MSNMYMFQQQVACLYTKLQFCTPSYKFVHQVTSMYKLQVCTNLYNKLRIFSTSYMSVQQVTSLYNMLHVMMPVQHVVTCLIRKLLVCATSFVWLYNNLPESLASIKQLL